MNWAARLIGGRFHYGWLTVGVVFLVLLAAAGTRATPSVMMVPLEHQFGWSRATISLAISVNIALYGLMGPFAAAAMQRFGVRPTLARRARHDGGGRGAVVADDASVADGPDLGRDGRRLDGRGGAVAVGDGRHALVHHAPWPRDGHSHGQFGDRPTGVPADARGDCRALRLAPGRVGRRGRGGGRVAAGRVSVAGASGGHAVAPVRRTRRRTGRQYRHQTESACHRVRHARHGEQDARFLAAVLQLLYLRREHQRLCRHAPDRDVRRLRHDGSAGRVAARRHGHLRSVRHDAVGLAVGPLQ